MKIKMTLSMFIIGLILCSTVVAYYPFLIVCECPHCNAQFVQEETVSGNTIGKEFYTEKRTYAPMLPEHPRFAKCPVCGGLFWVDENEKLNFGFKAAGCFHTRSRRAMSMRQALSRSRLRRRCWE